MAARYGPGYGFSTMFGECRIRSSGGPPDDEPGAPGWIGPVDRASLSTGPPAPGGGGAVPR